MTQQFKNFIQSCSNTDFPIFTKKVGVLPRLPEYPHRQKIILSNYTVIQPKTDQVKNHSIIRQVNVVKNAPAHVFMWLRANIHNQENIGT